MASCPRRIRTQGPSLPSVHIESASASCATYVNDPKALQRLPASLVPGKACSEPTDGTFWYGKAVSVLKLDPPCYGHVDNGEN